MKTPLIHLWKRPEHIEKLTHTLDDVRDWLFMAIYDYTTCPYGQMIYTHQQICASLQGGHCDGGNNISTSDD